MYPADFCRVGATFGTGRTINYFAFPVDEGYFNSIAVYGDFAFGKTALASVEYRSYSLKDGNRVIASQSTYFLKVFYNMTNQLSCRWITSYDGDQIGVYPGRKPESPYDFIVKFKEPNKRERTPAHVHLIVEMYVKHAHNPSLTLQLKEHILTMLAQIKPVNSFPPSLQFFKPEHIALFQDFAKVGQFTVEFLLVVTELMAIQEKTNYPEGSLTESLYRDFGVKDRFSVIQKAVLKRLR